MLYNESHGPYTNVQSLSWYHTQVGLILCFCLLGIPDGRIGPDYVVSAHSIFQTPIVAVWKKNN